MPRFLFYTEFTLEGLRAFLREGPRSRAGVMEQMVKNAGGTLEAFYYSEGGRSGYLLAELPDEATAAAISLRGTAGGGALVKSVSRLLDIEEMEAAVSKHIEYRPPGG